MKSIIRRRDAVNDTMGENMYNNKDICAVIVFYNGELDVFNKAYNLAKHVGKVLIVDNGSEENCRSILKNTNNIQVIFNKKNLGISFALNQGLDYAYNSGYKLLLTMDQDSVITGTCIDKMVEAFNRDATLVSAGPFYGNEKSQKDKAVSALITSGNLVLVHILKEIGGYTNKLFIDCVDIDLSFKILSHGFSLRKIGGTYMQHKIGDVEYAFGHKISYLGHKPVRYMFKFRNNIYIYKTYSKKLPVKCFKLFLSLTIEFVRLLFLENKKREKLKFVLIGVKQGLGFEEWQNEMLV